MSGTVDDGGSFGGTGGALIKVGTGTLTLTGKLKQIMSFNEIIAELPKLTENEKRQLFNKLAMS